MSDGLKTPTLVRETIEHLTRMALICRSADLPNVAAAMEDLASKWKRSMWFDGTPAFKTEPKLAAPIPFANVTVSYSKSPGAMPYKTEQMTWTVPPGQWADLPNGPRAPTPIPPQNGNAND